MRFKKIQIWNFPSQHKHTMFSGDEMQRKTQWESLLTLTHLAFDDETRENPNLEFLLTQRLYMSAKTLHAC
jgi:hypothetical protein